MEYRMRFKKVKKPGFFKKLFTQCKDIFIKSKNGIKYGYIVSKETLKQFYHTFTIKLQQFDEKSNCRFILGRIGLLLLAIIPLFVTLVPLLYSLFWFGMNIYWLFTNTPADVLAIMRPSFDAFCLNLFLLMVNIAVFVAVIRTAIDTLNADVYSVIPYFVGSSACMLFTGLVCAIILIPSWYSHCAVFFGYVLKILFSGILIKVFIETFFTENNSSSDDFDIVLIRRK